MSGIRRATWLEALRPLRLALAVMAVAMLANATVWAAGGLIELSAGIHRIEAEVANTLADRAEGLMHRHSLPANRGMLFVFPEPDQHCMWMRNTLIPLSAAFIDAKGVVINVAEMKPQTEINHCAAKPAKFVLEMNSGWFKSRGIAAGSKMGGLGRAPAGR